ncbi:MAG: flagellar biosynthesis anti-sigma factor FlgM [Clostridia bacterium]
MKINSSNYQNILKQYKEAKAQKPEETNVVRNDKTENSDKKTLQQNVADITISKDYKIYERAMKELNKMDAKDVKIKEIMNQIEKGEYDISPEEIAKSIIDKSKKS